MNCLSEELLQDLIDGQLHGNVATEAIAHIRSCDQCRKEFAELLALYEGIGLIVAEDACPSQTTLKAYNEKTLPSEEMATISKHIDFCNECRAHIWLLTASESELVKWRMEEEQAHRRYDAMIFGHDAAQEALARLLPAGLGFLDQLWDSISALVRDLRAKELEQWPQFRASAPLTGALGFAGPIDPQRTATAIILTSTLLVAEQITAKEVNASLEDITAAVRAAARAFGAGKELQKRLMETVPSILQKFYGPSDTHPSD